MLIRAAHQFSRRPSSLGLSRVFSTATPPSRDSPATPPRPSSLKIYAELSKARLSALVVMTTSAGFLAHGGPIDVPTLVAASTGTAFCASSASTWNQWLEIERDKKMKRTLHRPLPAGHVTANHAAVLATCTGAAGTALLAMCTDPLTTAMGLSNIFLYAVPYTLLKPRHEINTWVGAVVGAIPPVMGWTAAGGAITDPEVLFLGGSLYLWQFPHFFALSFMYRDDYARGGFQMVPVNDAPKFDRTASLITRYAVYLSTLPVISSAAGLTSSMFAVEGLVLNGYALYCAKKFSDDRTNGNAKRVFMTSLWYLPCLMTLFIFHSRNWGEEKNEAQEEDKDGLYTYLYSMIKGGREKGREVCAHEGSLPCPITTANKVKDAVVGRK